MSQILIFGDSITYGACDLEGGWVSRLRKFVDNKSKNDSEYDCLIYNLGVSGHNSTDILKQFEFEVQQRIKEEGETIIIFAFGTNDSQLFKGKFRTIQKEFEVNLQKLLDLSRKYSSKIFFVGLFPVDENKTAPVVWHKEKFYQNENIKNYNDTIKDFCAKNNLVFIKIFENFINQDYKILLEDGLHPNTEGHQQMYEIIKAYLIEKKII